MVRTASEKAARLSPRPEGAHFFVADAENAPLRPGIADVVSLSGILHHVESPNGVLAEASRVLKNGAPIVGNENNRSSFRFLFDWLMARKKLWEEKAHEHHFVMSGADLRAWCGQADLAAETWTSVFLPPHLFNLLSPRSAERALKVTDSIGRTMPWLRHQGGLVLYRGRKQATD
jgi:SAM-dependent methyltransferase